MVYNIFLVDLYRKGNGERERGEATTTKFERMRRKKKWKVLTSSQRKRMKKGEVWALWGVIWTRNEWDMAEGRIGNKGFRKSEKLQISDFEFWIYRGRDAF